METSVDLISVSVVRGSQIPTHASCNSIAIQHFFFLSFTSRPAIHSASEKMMREFQVMTCMVDDPEYSRGLMNHRGIRKTPDDGFNGLALDFPIGAGVSRKRFGLFCSPLIRCHAPLGGLLPSSPCMQRWRHCKTAQSG